ncbi:MAG: DUF2288 domain-containing protein [Chromatiaceae bacterium]
MLAEGQVPPDGRAEDALLGAKLNGETATAPWRELQRFFAQGAVVAVAPGLDLVEVGLAMSRDRAALFQDWLAVGQVAVATDAQARAWLAADTHLWTLVVKPWILVQELSPSSTGIPGGARAEPFEP